MRIYEKRYCNLVAPCGQQTCWSLGFPPEANIKNLRIKQVGGTLVDFKVTVYNLARACQPDSSSVGDLDGSGPTQCVADPDMYVVFPETSGQAGKLLSISDNYGRSFRNQDGTYTVPVRRIYVQIVPEGSGDATWDIAIGADVDVG